MNTQILEKYAELIIKTGINLRPGQNIIIKGDSCHWPFVDILQKVAYQNHAALIKCELTPPNDLINRATYQDPKYFSLTPSHLDNDIKTYIDEKWAYIRLEGSSNPDAYEGLDQNKMAMIEKPLREKSIPLMTAYMSGACHWTIAPIPTKKWAQKIFQSNHDDDLTDKLWETLIPILRLDTNDPVSAWKQHNEMLKTRIDSLEKMHLDYLHFRGPETDLKIFLSQHSKWAGGCFCDSDGVSFNPNLPTEEIFTTPDFRKTRGHIKVTKPVLVLNKSVEDAWFEFENGKVINYRASKNLDCLHKYFEMDEQSRYLGEVALVDSSSPISKTNRLFYSILLDENASCHIALGRGITAALKDCDHLSKEELINNGCNMSMLHTDFMVGSEKLNVTGYKNNGKSFPILKDGCFAI